MFVPERGDRVPATREPRATWPLTYREWFERVMVDEQTSGGRVPVKRAPNADARAMAVYLQALPQHAATPAKQAVAPASVMERGAKVYEAQCAQCHGAQGQGAKDEAGQPAFPPLAGNRSLMQPSPANPIRVVLNGGFAPGTASLEYLVRIGGRDVGVDQVAHPTSGGTTITATAETRTRGTNMRSKRSVSS